MRTIWPESLPEKTSFSKTQRAVDAIFGLEFGNLLLK
jgi:hypothetical protein